MEENMIVMRELETFYFDFDWHKNVDDHLKHEFESKIKSNASLAKNKKTRLKICF